MPSGVYPRKGKGKTRVESSSEAPQERKEESPAPGDQMSPDAGKPEQKPESAERAFVSDRLSFRLVDGKLEIPQRESGRERAKVAIKASISDPEFKKWLGIEPTTQLDAEFGKEMAAGCLNLIATAEAFFLAKKTGLEFKEVFELCEWSPEEHKQIDPPLARAAGRFVPINYMQYLELISLGGMIFFAMKAKADAISQLAKTRFNKIVQPTEPVPAAAEKRPEPEPKAEEPINVPQNGSGKTSLE